MQFLFVLCELCKKYFEMNNMIPGWVRMACSKFKFCHEQASTQYCTVAFEVIAFFHCKPKHIIYEQKICHQACCLLVVLFLKKFKPIWLAEFTLFWFLFIVIIVPEKEKEKEVEIVAEEVEVSETFTSEQEIVEETTQVDVEIELKPEGPEEGRFTKWLLSFILGSFLVFYRPN